MVWAVDATLTGKGFLLEIKRLLQPPLNPQDIGKIIHRLQRPAVIRPERPPAPLERCFMKRACLFPAPEATQHICQIVHRAQGIGVISPEDTTGYLYYFFE